MDYKNLERELIEIRHYLHEYPEIGFDLENTSAYIANKMEELGYEVVRGIGKVGLVCSMTRGYSNKKIGIRADMDALTINEENELKYKSKNEGRMHACGHDGHMTTALGAAEIISDSEFNGTVRFIFQPNEEHGKGALAMIDDGLFDKFPVDYIFGLHNMPARDEGKIFLREGGIMASEDNFEIHIRGKGGHASSPQYVVDPVVIAANIILGLQTIVSRNSYPTDTAVVSITEILTDGIRNAIPSNVILKGDTRSFTKETSKLIENRMREISISTAKAYGAECDVKYTHEFVPTINSKKPLEMATIAAKEVLGDENVVEDTTPEMVSEDFGYFSNIVPGCFAFLGGKIEGKEVYSLHSPKYNYNDRNLIKGAKYFAQIIKNYLV